MQFKSPLNDLSETLIEIQESAKLYCDTLKKNEAATRAVLIDPILRSLGWDTANTNMVEVEKTLEDVRADYALFDGNAIARILIEAKALGTDLKQKQLEMKLVNYAYRFRLNDVFLTDGIIWQHYDNFQPNNFSPTRVINLAKDNPIDCAAYFVLHLDAAKYWQTGQSIDVLSQRVDELENKIASLQKYIVELAVKKKEDQPFPYYSPEQPNEKFVSLEDLKEIVGKKPTHFRLPNGDVLEITTWKDVLRESCKFTLVNNPSINIPCPDRVGKKVALFSYERPANRVSYVTEQYNGQKIFIYLNYDSNNCVANAIYILKKCPVEIKKYHPAVIVKP